MKLSIINALWAWPLTFAIVMFLPKYVVYMPFIKNIVLIWSMLFGLFIGVTIGIGLRWGYKLEEIVVGVSN